MGKMAPRGQGGGERYPATLILSYDTIESSYHPRMVSRDAALVRQWPIFARRRTVRCKNRRWREAGQRRHPSPCPNISEGRQQAGCAIPPATRTGEVDADSTSASRHVSRHGLF